MRLFGRFTTIVSHPPASTYFCATVFLLLQYQLSFSIRKIAFRPPPPPPTPLPFSTPTSAFAHATISSAGTAVARPSAISHSHTFKPSFPHIDIVAVFMFFSHLGSYLTRIDSLGRGQRPLAKRPIVVRRKVVESQVYIHYEMSHQLSLVKVGICACLQPQQQPQRLLLASSRSREIDPMLQSTTTELPQNGF